MNNFSHEKMEQTAREIAKVIEKITESLEKVKALKVEGRGIKIRVPEDVCQYDAIVRVISKHAILSKKIPFNLPQISEISGTFMPSLIPLREAIQKAQEGFWLSMNNIPPGTEYILLSFQYKIHDSHFVSNLVETRVATEPYSYPEKDEYWMHAQLKFPRILQKTYTYLSIEDLELNVDVAVDNEVKTAIPRHFVKSLQIIRKLLAETNREKAHRLLLQHMQHRRRLGMDIYEIITGIQVIFLPDSFRNFIEVSPPFRCFKLEQGREFYDFPGQIVPKTMTVISRTDLNLERPAVEGKVIYRKRKLLEELSKVIK